MEKEFDLKEYQRKDIKKKTFCLIGLTFLLLLAIALGSMHIILFFFVTIPCIFVEIFVLKLTIEAYKSGIVLGKIIDVIVDFTTVNPRTLAKIEYEVEEKKYYTLRILSYLRNDDDKEGEERTIEQMLETDKKYFLGKQTPVFYNKKKVQHTGIYFDVFI